MQRVMTAPTYSALVMTWALMKGSSTWSSLPGSGNSEGLLMTIASPFLGWQM